MNKIRLRDEYNKLFDMILSGENITILRYGDGERAIMTGDEVVAQEGWVSSGESSLGCALRESLKLADSRVYYGISCPCCDRAAYYWYSSRIKDSNITFANLFVNANYSFFKNDFLKLKRDAVVIANHRGMNHQIGNLNVLKYYPVGDNCIECWESECESLVQQVIDDFGNRNDLLYVVSAGPMAEPIIDRLFRNNPNNCYIDFGSSIDLYIHGVDSRPYAQADTVFSKRNCWMFDPVKTSFDVTVVLSSYKKPDALVPQLEAIRHQTLKPSKVYLFQDGIDGHYSISFSDEFLDEFDLVVNCKKNMGVWERFRFASRSSTPYTCVFDDDTIPGSRWLENCHFNMMHSYGIYGTVGIVLEEGYGYPGNGNYYRVGWVSPNNQLVKVDFVGHSWFAPSAALRYMFEDTDHFQEYRIVGEDMCLSVKASEHGISTFVPPHPFNDESLWGSSFGSAMSFGRSESALSMNPANLKLMSQAIEDFAKSGHKFLFQTDPGLVSSQKRMLRQEAISFKLKSLVRSAISKLR